MGRWKRAELTDHLPAGLRSASYDHVRKLSEWSRTIMRFYRRSCAVSTDMFILTSRDSNASWAGSKAMNIRRDLTPVALTLIVYLFAQNERGVVSGSTTTVLDGPRVRYSG